MEFVRNFVSMGNVPPMSIVGGNMIAAPNRNFRNSSPVVFIEKVADKGI
jgi:hypothetical protein